VTLSAEQRVLLQRLLEEELRAAWRSATNAGVPPAALGAYLDERLRALELASGLPDDLLGDRDDPRDDGGIAEQL
jgi:hypothetical protein